MSEQVKIGDLTFEIFEQNREEYGFNYYKKPAPWRWHCKSSNGRLVCTSGENFASKSNAVRAMKGFINSVINGLADYVKTESENDE